MPTYIPGPLPSTLDVQRALQALYRELQALQGASEFAEALRLPVLNAEPAKREAGMVVYADGVNWNPGSGEGVYRRNKANAAWVFLG